MSLSGMVESPRQADGKKILQPRKSVGVGIWLFGIFSSGPRADDGKQLPEMDARFLLVNFLIHSTRKTHNQTLTPLP